MRTNLSSQISLNRVSPKYYKPENAVERSVLTRCEKVPTDIYETMEEGAKIYSLQSLLTPTPKPKDDPAFKDKEGKDPVEVVSIWLGRDYLNMILNLKVSTGKGHTFGIIEDKSELETTRFVDMLLYHDADSDEEYYNRRAYISVPLKQYAESEHPADGIKIKFRYYTYGKEADVIEDYEFEYTPGKTE